MNFSKNENFQFKIREDLFIVIIFLMISISILSKSYFSTSGYLSPDSTKYLELSRNLLDGKGLRENDGQYFAIWPVGYPYLIFVIAKLTSLSVFWSSKVLNIILLASTFGVLKLIFKRDAYLYCCIFLFASYIEIYAFTWSETTFILGLIWFAASLIFIIKAKSKDGILPYVSILISSILLFLSRYIGAFSFGFIGLFGLYYGFVRKDKLKSIILFSITVLNLAIMFGYIYHNKIETGFITGKARIPSPESNGQLLYMLIKAMISEAVIHSTSTYIKENLYFIMMYSVLLFFIIKYRKNIFSRNISMKSSKKENFGLVFVTIGIAYLFLIIAIRWRIHFDNFQYRLLAPGSLMIFIAIIHYFEKSLSKQCFHAFKILLVTFSIFSWSINVPYAILIDNEEPTYIENIRKINQIYSNVEKGSIIVFGTWHLNYLYPDLVLETPYYHPYYANKENWTDFLNRIKFDNKANIYLAKPEEYILTLERFDKSVVDIVKAHSPKDLIKLSGSLVSTSGNKKF